MPEKSKIKIFLSSRARVAGIITLISLIFPWYLSFGYGPFDLIWLFFGYEFSSLGSYFYNLQLSFGDMMLNAVICALLFIGAVLLLEKPSLQKLGASIVLAGTVISIIDFAYTVFQSTSNGFELIPVGLFLAMAGGSIGILAESPVSTSTLSRGARSVKRVRLSILVGQIALLGLGLFLLLIGIDSFIEQSSYYPSLLYMAYYYLSMPSLQVVLLGILCIIGAILLSPVARYEVNVEKEEKTRGIEKTIICPNCRRSIPEGSKFCNICGHKIKN
jgi:hypothetical protein